MKVSESEEIKSLTCSNEILTELEGCGDEVLGSVMEIWVSFDGGGEIDTLRGGEVEILGVEWGGRGKVGRSYPSYLIHFPSSFLKFIVLRVPRV